MMMVSKFSSNLLWSILVLLIGGFLSLEKPDIVQARHGVDPKCYTFAGQTETVPFVGPGDISNGGSIDFDARSGSHKFQTCGSVDGAGNLDVLGWAWNTNLGDISFQCLGGKNFGIPCGALIDYGSSVVNISGQDYLVGYAWGDNIGWISLGCRNFDGDPALENFILGDVGNPASEMACGSVEYGGEVAVDGSLSGYAYSENFGWVNLLGARINIPVISLDPGEDGGLSVLVDPGAGGDPLEETPEMPAGRFTYINGAGEVAGYAYANGEDYYELGLQILEDGVPLTCAQLSARNIQQITLSPNPLNAAENIRYDQTVPGGTRSAMTMDSFTCNAATNTYFTRLRSVAPTNTAPNGQSYDPFILQSMTATIDDFRGIPRQIVIPGGNQPITFVPAVYIKSFGSPDAEGVTQPRLYATRNTSTPVSIEGGRYRSGGFIPANPQVDISGMYQADPAGPPYLYFDDPEGDGPVYVEGEGPLEDQNSVAIQITAQTFAGTADSSAGVMQNPTPHTRYVYAYLSSPAAQELQADSGTIALTVTYTTVLPSPHAGRTVRYVTSSLDAGSTFNQFAQIRGNIRLEKDAFQEVADRTVIQGLAEKRAQSGLPTGEASKADSRGRLIKTITNLFRGKSVTQVAGGASISITESLIQRADNNNNILYYKRNGGASPFKLVIDDPIADPSLPETTIICEGCDFYINANISDSSPGSPPALKFGLIVLEDPTLSGQRRGGNVYIDPSVTETSLHIYSDGSVMSYADGLDFDSEGIPQFGAQDVTTVLKNQYTNYGRIRSANTLGGSTLALPVTGEGEIADTQSLLYKARMQDLNFLRYAKTIKNPAVYNVRRSVEQNIADFGPPYWFATGTTLSPSLGNGEARNIAAVNYLPAYGIVNFFDSDSSGLPIFEALQ